MEVENSFLNIGGAYSPPHLPPIHMGLKIHSI